MPRHILFIQGGGEGVHDQWDNKLVESLRRELGDGYEVQYPRMPDEADPHYAAWKQVVVAALEGMRDGDVLVGHSVGGTALLHVLAEVDVRFRPGALVLIAPPYIGEGGWPSDDMPAIEDFSQSLPEGIAVRFYHGDDDATVPKGHMALYARVIPGAVMRALPGRDHQLNNDLSEVARDIRNGLAD